MTTKKKFWERLPGWVQTLLQSPSPEPDPTSKTAPAKQIPPSIPSPPSRASVSSISTKATKPSSPFIEGLDNIEDLGGLSARQLLKLMNWDTNPQNDLAVTNVSAFLGDLGSEKTTEAILQGIEWDAEPITISSPEPEKERIEVPDSFFIAGLEDVTNLESLKTQDLLQLLAWETDEKTVLSVNPDDLSLLDDLLESFPD